jgi:uncharacterized protein YbaA (DUF1428 family)
MRMARYVDGYVLPVPKKKLDVYRRIAQKAGRIWREHGALEYRECAGEDLNVAWGKTFLRLANAKPGETVVFSYIVFKSRARSREPESDEGSAHRKDGSQVDAGRRQANGLRWLFDHRLVGLSSQLLAFSYQRKPKLRADG